MTGGTTYHHFGLDTETQTVYYVLIEEIDEKRIQNGTISLSNRYQCLAVKRIENNTQGMITCDSESLFNRDTTLSMELNLLSDGDISLTRYVMNYNTRVNMNTTKCTIPSTGAQTFYTQGHSDFDKLAVLFTAPA